VFALSTGTSFVDLDFQGMRGVIATGVVTDPAGVTLVDPGPTSCLDTLRRALGDAGIRLEDVRHVLLTHIHLDHAGVVGTLVQQNPAIEVHVHERGARHMIDPSRLIDSATRLYGTMMGPLWGAMLPVPAERVKALTGGERITIGARTFDVAYTPGHASHHVSYLQRDIGLAWVGDTAGVRVGTSRLALPPTPPPDVDLDAWDVSLAKIRAWEASRLFLTHFGPVESVPGHLDDFAVRLRETAGMVRRSLDRASDESGQFAAFSEEFGRYIRRSMSERDASAYELAAPNFYNWQGLVRYWRKRAADR
jgi:glyoxylase-like metal-dependent hydrolase (beta-lactamase superfamily II)